MLRIFSYFITMTLVSGCASTQVNYNSLDIANTYDTLITKQVVFNLIKTFKDRFSIPAYVKIATQTASTSNGVNPTFTAPISAQSTLTQASNFLVTQRGSQIAGSGLSLQLQASWQQNYTLSPVTDPDQLRRIRSIYQYVTGHMSEFDFESDYPIIATSGVDGGVSTQNTVVSGSFAGKSFAVTIGSPKPDVTQKKTVYVRRACSHSVGDKCVEYYFPIIQPDKTFIRLPGCVMCDLGNTLANLIPNTNVIVLQKNPRLFGPSCNDTNKWQERTPCKDEDSSLFFYRPGESGTEPPIPVQANGSETLDLKGPIGVQAFYELALFTQEAASQGTGSPTSGGQSEGRKTSPLQTISGPGLTPIP